MEIQVKRLHEKARIPEIKHEGDACYDLYPVSREIRGGFAYYGLGFATAIPAGYEVEIHSRSGIAFNDHIKVFNGVGHIDAGYRGEWMVKLSYHGPVSMRPDWPSDPEHFTQERIAQCKLVRLVKTKWVEVEELGETDRGDGGMGSTGK